MRFVGIDPGLDGALARIDGDGLHVVDMPTIGTKKRTIDTATVVEILVAWGHLDLLAVEQVSTRPGLAATSVLTTGYGAGILEGVAVALDRPLRFVRPQVWTAHCGLPAGADKDAHRATARRLFPADAHLFERKRDDGRADAALIAHWAASTQSRGAG